MVRVNSVNLFGQKYKVKWQTQLEETNQEQFFWGLSNYLTKEIKIALVDIEGRPFTEKELENTFLHEVLHALLHEGAYHAESENEAFIEFLSRNLTQIINAYKK